MLTFFELLLLGHLVGDYVLQNNWMAQRKGSSLFACLVHCLIYTASVCLFTEFSVAWACVVFLSHFPIDRWSLADKWGRLIRGRSLTEFFVTAPEDMLRHGTVVGGVTHNILRGSFTALVYVVIDNTFHLLLMVGGAWLLRFLGLLG